MKCLFSRNRLSFFLRLNFNELISVYRRKVQYLHKYALAFFFIGGGWMTLQRLIRPKPSFRPSFSMADRWFQISLRSVFEYSVLLGSKYIFGDGSHCATHASIAFLRPFTHVPPVVASLLRCQTPLINWTRDVTSWIAWGGAQASPLEKLYANTWSSLPSCKLFASWLYCLFYLHFQGRRVPSQSVCKVSKIRSHMNPGPNESAPDASRCRSEPPRYPIAAPPPYSCGVRPGGCSFAAYSPQIHEHIQELRLYVVFMLSGFYSSRLLSLQEATYLIS